jgi:hypothetical protein
MISVDTSTARFSAPGVFRVTATVIFLLGAAIHSLVSNLKRQASAPTTATAAILAVHFLPPAARTDGIGLRKGGAVIVAAAAVGIVAVAVGRVIPAAMAMTLSPPAAPVGNVLWL